MFSGRKVHFLQLPWDNQTFRSLKLCLHKCCPSDKLSRTIWIMLLLQISFYNPGDKSFETDNGKHATFPKIIHYSKKYTLFKNCTLFKTKLWELSKKCHFYWNWVTESKVMAIHSSKTLAYFSQFLPDLSLIIFMSRYHGCQLWKKIISHDLICKFWEKSPNFKEIAQKLWELWTKIFGGGS